MIRPVVHPSALNGLKVPCYQMVDKVSTFPKTKMGTRIGRLDAPDQTTLDRTLVVFLGLAG